MERDCESELSKLNIEQNACIYHFGASVIHGQRSNILRLHYTMRQLKLPLEIAKLIDISDPVYTFCVQCIDIDPMLCTFDGKIQSHIWSLSEISGC